MDAIISQEWQHRYFSYQSEWSKHEEFCEMRNGQGDNLLVLFRKDGCVINGMAHDFYPKNKQRLTSGLPQVFHEFVFGEPVSSIGTTFCLWATDNTGWQTGEIEDFNDGSSEMLWLFEGNPQTYIDWAQDYYEDDFIVNSDTQNVVADVYAGKALNEEMIFSIVRDIDNWQQLKSDLNEIDYPHQLP